MATVAIDTTDRTATVCFVHVTALTEAARVTREGPVPLQHTAIASTQRLARAISSGRIGIGKMDTVTGGTDDAVRGTATRRRSQCHLAVNVRRYERFVLVAVDGLEARIIFYHRVGQVRICRRDVPTGMTIDTHGVFGINTQFKEFGVRLDRHEVYSQPVRIMTARTAYPRAGVVLIAIEESVRRRAGSGGRSHVRGTPVMRCFSPGSRTNWPDLSGSGAQLI